VHQCAKPHFKSGRTKWHDSIKGPVGFPATRLTVLQGLSSRTAPFAVLLSHVADQPVPSTAFVMRHGHPGTLCCVQVPARARRSVRLPGMGWQATEAPKQLVVLVGATPADLGRLHP
jgi:hypothetical protein